MKRSGPKVCRSEEKKNNPSHIFRMCCSYQEVVSSIYGSVEIKKKERKTCRKMERKTGGKSMEHCNTATCSGGKEKTVIYFKIAQVFHISLLVESYCDQHGKKSSGEELS